MDARVYVLLSAFSTHILSLSLFTRSLTHPWYSWAVAYDPMMSLSYHLMVNRCLLSTIAMVINIQRALSSIFKTIKVISRYFKIS